MGLFTVVVAEMGDWPREWTQVPNFDWAESSFSKSPMHCVYELRVFCGDQTSLPMPGTQQVFNICSIERPGSAKAHSRESHLETPLLDLREADFSWHLAPLI